MSSFSEFVELELNRLRLKAKKCNSWHEAYGLILEELDEFWEEVRKKSSKRSRANALRELIQIATLCQIVAEDLDLVRQDELVLQGDLVNAAESF